MPRAYVTRPPWMPAKTTGVTELPPGSPTGKAATNILAAEQLAELRALKKTTTESMGRLAGLIINDVLDVRSFLFATGALSTTQNYHVACGCVAVDNQGQNTMWVQPGGSTAPGQAGPNSTPIPAGAQRIVNLASRSFTITGIAGDLVAWQSFTRGGIPGDGLGSVNGGTG